MKKLTLYILSFLIIFYPCVSAGALSRQDNLAQITDDGLWQYMIFDDNNAEITGYMGKEKNISIPQYIDDYTVTSIGTAAFYDSDIENVAFPTSIDSVGWWAFYGCKELSSVALNDGLNTIENGAFMNCYSLKEISLPYTVCSIGKDAFGVSCTSLKGINDHYSKTTVSKQYYSYNKKFTIYSFNGTYSQKYAADNNLKFVGKSQVVFCDADLNGTVDKNDIILLEKYINNKANLNDSQKRNCDVDGDAKITSADTKLIEKYVYNQISLSELPVAENIEEKTIFLNNKTMYCDGDSVARGVGTNIFGNDYYSYCNYLTETYNMKIVNKSVSGTTLAKRKDIKSPEKRSILERVKEMKGSYDIVLLEGGFNDLFKKVEIGEVTDINDKSGNYNEYTTAGALESICYFLNHNYADSVKLFVLCHTRKANPNQYKYWNIITNVLDKWNIDYVDISSETDFCDANDEISTQYFKYNSDMKKGDGIHPLKYAAKKVYGPLVAEKLNELFLDYVDISFADENIELGLGENYYQSPVITGQYDDYSARWSSDNPAVATVNSNGEISARGIGTTKIRYCTNDGITASFTVTVKFMAMDLVLDSAKLNLISGESRALGASFLNGTTAHNLSFTSSDSTVAVVSQKSGVVTAVGRGKAVIKCKTPSGVVAQCTVTVQ